MKILFIHRGREHLGIEYLSSMLKEKGEDVYLAHDLGLFSKEDNVFYSPVLEKMFSKEDRILEMVATLKPDLVAFSVYTTTYQWALRLAEIIKEKYNPGILFGGIHVTLTPEKVIQHSFIDFIIIGEGEYALLELVEALKKHSPLTKINNLWYKKDNHICRNELRAPIADLDTLPLPDKELFRENVRYCDDYMIMTSRGCPSSCNFCCEGYLNNLYGNKYFRRRKVESVIKELAFAKEKYHFKEVMFFDGIFFTDKIWLGQLLAKYKEIIRVPFRCIGHVNYFDEGIARMIKEAGGYCIEFGLQTFNEKIRQIYLNRNETNEQAIMAFKICDKLKIRYDVDLMLGLPDATEEDYRLSLKILSECEYLNRIKCYFLSYYPKLPVIDKAKEIDLLSDDDIEKIEEGETGDWFHIDSTKGARQRNWNKLFSKIYKIYPLLPKPVRRTIALKKIHKCFYFVPNIMVVLLQLFIGLKNRDHRFKIYVNNYWYNLKKELFHSYFD